MSKQNKKCLFFYKLKVNKRLMLLIRKFRKNATNGK